jgi:polyhydroxyalkanoate synthase
MLAWARSSGWSGGSPNWSDFWRHATTAASPSDPADLAQTFAGAIAADRDLIAGIAAYRRFPWQRAMPEVPVVWEEGGSQLLDFGTSEVSGKPPVLFVPSLINRAYILDLMPDASMLRWLAAQGVHPYLMDWGWPEAAERRFTLTDYIVGRLERALTAVSGPLVLAGYCMGGLLALAEALRQPGKVSALALLATPWDFHAADAASARRLGEALPLLEPLMGFSGTLPIDALQTLFTMLDPHGVGEKYRSFAHQDHADRRAKRFVAMEDWLADGVPLAAPVAREALGGWYGQNSPARGTWAVAGLNVDPAALKVPAFCAVPARDRLVPPQSARPLAAILSQCTIVEPPAGHIGMIAGSHAQSTLWRPFAGWLRGLQ